MNIFTIMNIFTFSRVATVLAPITKCHTLGGLHNSYLFSHSPGSRYQHVWALVRALPWLVDNRILAVSSRDRKRGNKRWRERDTSSHAMLLVKAAPIRPYLALMIY